MGKVVPKTKSDAQTTAGTLWKLAAYTLAMMCVPIGLFLLVAEKYLDPLFAATIGVPSPDKRSIVAGIFAVIGVNVVVIAFVTSAFREEDAKPAGKED
mmetsp:Transcript_14621/g.36403  ORF Transcript_14621/g.36403 Transcript_14621/m.36403 type:complete len:98 (-) Transcript_14621:1180-1473(-)